MIGGQSFIAAGYGWLDCASCNGSLLPDPHTPVGARMPAFPDEQKPLGLPFLGSGCRGKEVSQCRLKLSVTSSQSLCCLRPGAIELMSQGQTRTRTSS